MLAGFAALSLGAGTAMAQNQTPATDFEFSARPATVQRTSVIVQSGSSDTTWSGGFNHAPRRSVGIDGFANSEIEAMIVPVKSAGSHGLATFEFGSPAYPAAIATWTIDNVCVLESLNRARAGPG